MNDLNFQGQMLKITYKYIFKRTENNLIIN